MGEPDRWSVANLQAPKTWAITDCERAQQQELRKPRRFGALVPLGGVGGWSVHKGGAVLAQAAYPQGGPGGTVG
jgi:hypothetical protein